MAHRIFSDRTGDRWEVVPAGKSEWTFEPIEGNPGPARTGTPPGYETDPFELSVEELERLLHAAQPRRKGSRPSPFLD